MSEIWLTYNGKVIRHNAKILTKPYVPPMTLRFQFSNTAYVPTVGSSSSDTASKGSWTAYDASNGIWDWTCTDPNWNSAFDGRLSRTRVGGPGSRTSVIMAGDTSNVTSTRRMFASTTVPSSLRSVALFDTSNVTDMSHMFYECRELNTVPFFDTSNVTTMEGTFKACSTLKSVPLFNTSKVTSMKEAFFYCYDLESIPLFDTSNVTDMLSAFECCESIEYIPLLDTSKVTRMRAMFAECYSLKEIPLLNTSSATDVYGMFYRCRQVESGALALYQQMSSQANPPSVHTECFYECGSNTTTGAAELAQIPSDWKEGSDPEPAST